jgi:hypothetical protein
VMRKLFKAKVKEPEPEPRPEKAANAG